VLHCRTTFCNRNPAHKLDEGLRRVKLFMCVVPIAPRCVANARARYGTDLDHSSREGLPGRAVTTA
jgi:hypothetical protein